jgi:hypothetical protein
VSFHSNVLFTATEQPVIPLFSTLIFSRYVKYGIYVTILERKKKNMALISIDDVHIYIGKLFG